MTNKGMKYINNGVHQTMIHIEDELPEGYSFGKLPITEETRKKLSESHKGKKQKKESIERMKNTFREKYGVNSPSQLEGVNKKISDKLSSKEVQDKMKQTCLERYGVESVLQDTQFKDKMRETNLKRHGNRNYNNKEKEYNTRKENNTLGLFETQDEKELYNFLIDYYGEDDVLKQYRTDKYPFKSDFYIKHLDCYIEYHGFWTHGGHPFDRNNENDIKTLELWKSRNYDNAIYTWTDLDVRKSNYKDKINLIIIYPDKHNDIVYSFMKIKAELKELEQQVMNVVE